MGGWRKRGGGGGGRIHLWDVPFVGGVGSEVRRGGKD